MAKKSDRVFVVPWRVIAVGVQAAQEPLVDLEIVDELVAAIKEVATLLAAGGPISDLKVQINDAAVELAGLDIPPGETGLFMAAQAYLAHAGAFIGERPQSVGQITADWVLNTCKWVPVEPQITFEYGRSDAPPDSVIEKLDDVAFEIGQTGLEPWLVGYADPNGDPLKNLSLSRQRAEAVLAKLVKSRPRFVGYGEVVFPHSHPDESRTVRLFKCPVLPSTTRSPRPALAQAYRQRLRRAR